MHRGAVHQRKDHNKKNGQKKGGPKEKKKGDWGWEGRPRKRRSTNVELWRMYWREKKSAHRLAGRVGRRQLLQKQKKGEGKNNLVDEKGKGNFCVGLRRHLFQLPGGTTVWNS